MVADRPDSVPPSVRIIRNARRLISQRTGLVVAVGAALLLLLIVAEGLYTVDNGESAAVRRFGRVIDDAVGPGLHFAIPGGIDTVRAYRTGEVFRLRIQGDLRPELEFLTGDENIIDTEVVVQYRVNDLASFLFASEDPEEIVRQTVRTALQRVVATTSVEDVLTAAKAGIQIDVRDHTQHLLDLFGCGVTLVSVNLQSVTPPVEAAPAFRAVNDARAEAAETVNRTRARRSRTESLARGEAAGELQKANAAAEAREQQARGSALRFESLRRQTLIGGRQTRDTMLHDALQSVLPRARIVLVPPGMARRVDLNLLEEDRNPLADEPLPFLDQ